MARRVSFSIGYSTIGTAILSLSASVAFAAEPKASSDAAAKKPERARRWDYPVDRKPVRQIALERVPLPPLPDGVEELKFADFFKMPVGPRGLELTERAQALDGKRVRIVGLQVREQLGTCSDCSKLQRPGMKPRPAWVDHIVPGRLMVSPVPSTINMAHYGLSDDLPPQTLYVNVPEFFGEPVPFTPGLLLLTGKLSVGNKTEPDGRISVLRLELEAPPQPAEPALSSTSPDPTLSITNKTTIQP